jgi:hypothetical protein
MKLLLKSLALFLGLAIASPALAFSYSCSDWDYDDLEWEAHVLFWKEGTPASIADCIQDMGFVMGFAVTDRDDDGSTPLHYAARWTDDPMVIMVFLEAGADVNAIDAEGSTPLHIASSGQSNPNIINTLIMAGADVDARDMNGQTPLHRAVQNHYGRKGVLALVEAGADGSLREDYWDMTPFDYAKRQYGVDSEVYRVLSDRFR